LKNYKKYILLTVAALTLFGLGTLVDAEDVGWKDQIVNDAESKIKTTTSNEASQLLGDINGTIADQLSDDLSGTVAQKQNFLKDFIKNYFAGKLDELKDTPEYLNIQREIDLMTDAELTRVKQQIDTAISNAMK
jgi:hypothetical protein